jgi:signal transduction histidine kinase
VADALATLHEGKKVALETRIKFKYGVERDVSFHVSPIFDNGRFAGAIAVIQDLTARKALEDQVARKRRMEAVGTMARGVANDFNNALHSIVGLIQIAQSEVQEGTPAYEALSRAMRVGLRSGDLAGQILTFSGENNPNEREASLSKTVESSLEIVRRLIPPNIVLKTGAIRDTGTIFTDPPAITQVVVSLCSNAIDAMKDAGGILEVETDSAVVDNEMFVSQPDIMAGALRPGEYVTLTIKDNGHGMDERVKERIFEPFFTTKPHNNEGRGLSLAAVHGIVMRLNGAIAVKSHPGAGSEFAVFLPRKKVYA